MQHSLAFLTQHMHVMMQLSTLAQVIVAIDCVSNNESIKIVEGIRFSKGSLSILVDLITANHILIEGTPYTFMSLSEYFEKVFGEKHQGRVVGLSKDILRVNNQIYYYEHAIELAIELKYHFSDERLNLRDCLDLVIASMSNTQFYISNKRDIIQSSIESFSGSFLDFEGLQVHCIDSFVEFIENDTNFLDLVANQDLISLYTRESKLISIKKGSTPVDFAYKIHTELGHACYRAKVTRRYGRSNQYSFECDLDFILEDGDKVEIVKKTNGSKMPDMAWCKFVVTDKAIDAIQSFWNKENIRRGNVILKREFGDCYLSGNKFKYISHCLKCGNIEELQQRIGSGEIDIQEVRKKESRYSNFILSKIKASGLYVAGSISDTIVSPITGEEVIESCILARCCYPMPGESICGIRSKRATYVHRSSCPTIFKVPISKKKRLTWNTDKCSALIQVRMKDREDITRCVLNVIASHLVRVNLVCLKPSCRLYPTSERTSTADMCVLFESMLHLKTLIKDIEDINGIIQVNIRAIFPGANAYENPFKFIQL